MKTLSSLQKHASEAGFTLLIAVLVSGIFLSIATSIANITLKQIVLASIAKDSQLAISASDAGLECALYWDQQYNDNGATIENNSAFPINSADASDADGVATVDGDVSCGGQDLVTSTNPIDTDWTVISDADSASTVFSFSLGTTASDPCAEVTVKKEASGGNIITTIESRGHNICSAGARRTERLLEASFVE